MIARHWRGADDLVLVEQVGQLTAQSTPVGSELLDAQRLLESRPQPEVHLSRCEAGQGLERVGVEAKLQDVAGLALGTRQFRVDRLVGAVAVLGVVHAHEEVGDAADALMHEGHLVHDVITVLRRVADPLDPLEECLVGVAPGHLVDRATRILKLEQAVALVGGALVDQ